MDKNNADPSSPTVDRVTLDSVYSLDTTLVSVQMKVFTSNNAGYVFYAGGSAMIDNSADPYGAIIYGYTETEVLLWRPGIATSNGYLVYVGGQWGGGNNNQQDTSVEVTVKVAELTGSPCTGTNQCSADWTTLKTTCTPTDCPDPPDLANAYKINKGVSNGSAAMYSCMPGYYQSSYDVIITCIDGSWTSSTMFCEEICASPPSIPNADLMVLNNIAIYSCQGGYIPQSGSSLINCSQSVWQTTTFSCLASCGPAPNITSADVLVNDNVAIYACHYGFSATSSDNEIKCTSGTWSPTTFQCADSTNNGGSSINNQTLNGWIARIKKELIISRKRTNAYLRSLISVHDPRPSAIAIGSSGVFIFSFVFLLIMIPDIINVVRYLHKEMSDNFVNRKSDD
ncbi:sushi, von Willebrand factor type A, EGF and pentraxin domain-containing protein 1-like [Saccostrea echinata]|uniref:sushi, von Willebrand factor type A, EGF and pentraxin domain-containing protein 1-like n=1 Tax=Saccostrea echinata TaxID=191078 RepID=UPI002A7F7DC2|nr:sushi, von Willebrand factor type A, EGF and pentraxin domain-containing protein 1-like [Saccostrea echinata]